MRTAVGRFLPPFLLLGLALLAAAPVQAGSKEFDRLVCHVEQQLGTAKTDIPCGWLVGLAVRFAKPEGVKGLQFAVFEDVPGDAAAGFGELEAGARACLGPGWARMVCQRCPARNEAQLIWVQPAKNEVRLMIVSVDDGDAAVLHVRLDPDVFYEWMDEPAAIARRVQRTQ